MSMGCPLLVIPVLVPVPVPVRGAKAVNEYGLIKFRRTKDVSLDSGKCPFKRERRRPICKCQLIDLAPATSATYGTLLLAGGIFAFNKSKSKGSLFGGLTGATLMATANYLMQQQDTKAVGDALAFGSAFLFASVFGIRLAASRKLIPAGPLLGLSICSMAVFISSYFQDSL